MRCLFSFHVACWLHELNKSSACATRKALRHRFDARLVAALRLQMFDTIRKTQQLIQRLPAAYTVHGTVFPDAFVATFPKCKEAKPDFCTSNKYVCATFVPSHVCLGPSCARTRTVVAVCDEWHACIHSNVYGAGMDLYERRRVRKTCV